MSCSPLGPGAGGGPLIFFFGGDAGAYPAAAFLGPFAPNAGLPPESSFMIKVPFNCTLRNLRVGLVAGGTISSNDAVRVNGLSTFVTCMIAVGNNAAEDLSNTVAGATNADLSILITGEPTAGTVLWATLEAHAA